MSSVLRILLPAMLLAWSLGQSSSAALPLTPDRVMQLDTTEGTWISLDVAPDGSTIVFDLLGDLYRMSIEGGEAKPLFTGLPFDTQPVFSPDGSEIAFVSDRSGAENFWVARADGSSPRQISFHTGDKVFISPAWSADGSKIFGTVFRADLNAYELWAFDAAGEHDGEMVIPARTTPEQARATWTSVLGAVPSPDGKYLYFARHAGVLNFKAPEWAIYRRDLATGKDEAVVAPADMRRRDGTRSSYFRPVLSPDGQWLAYATRYRGRTALRLRNLVTEEDRPLAYPVQRDQLGASPWQDLMPGYSFTPDGSALVFSHDGKIRRLAIESGESVEIPFAARIRAELGPDLRMQIKEEEGPVRARLIQSPEQSPDGSRLAFSALGQIFVQPLDGEARPEPLAEGLTWPQYQPSWSADGNAIVFITWSAGEGGHIWIAAADGQGAPRRITQRAAFYTNPVFAPGGDSIIALRSSHALRMQRYVEFGIVRDAHLVEIPARGGPARSILRGEIGGKPTFLHGNLRESAVMFEDGLHAVDLESGQRRHLLSVQGPGWYFVEGPGRVQDIEISSDGRWALALNAHQLHLVAIPEEGDEPVDLSDPATSHRQITAVGADFLGWGNAGQAITWAVGSTFYRCLLVPLGESGGDHDDGQPVAGYGCGPIEEFEAVVERRRDIPRGALLLRGATILTMHDGQMLENGDLLVIDNRIAGVGERGELALPAGVEIFDVSGRFIVPGFIDTHHHVADIRRGVLDFESWGPAANLAYGVTTTFDPSTLSIDMLAYQDLVDAGLMIGSRIRSTGPAIFSFNRFESLDEVRNVLRRYRDHYRTRNLKMYRTGNRAVRQWVAMAAKDLGMMPTTEGTLAMKLGLSQVQDGFAGLEHEIPAYPLGEDVIKLMAESGAAYTPTLIIAAGAYAEDYFMARYDPANDPKINHFWPGYVIDMKLRTATWRTATEYSFPLGAAGAASVLRAGGTVAVGAHGNLPGIGTHWEMEALAMGGMTPLEVLQAATIHGARAIGRDAEFGSLAAGKYADLVILKRDPRLSIQHTRSIDQVMKNGRLYEADSLDEIWPRKRAFPRPWFHNYSQDPAVVESTGRTAVPESR
jgi:Tol biopolymer transport system component/imidazolonepropionase-like amidohydrolase